MAQPRRVVVDLLSVTGQRGGTETYAREIVRRLPSALPGTEFIALANRAGADLVRSYFPGDVHVLRWVGADRVTWALAEVLAASGFARRRSADVMWCPANFGPVSKRVARVTTVHDATYHTSTGSLVENAVARTTAWLMGRTAHSSTEILTGAAVAEAAIVESIGIDPARITVVPHGTTDPSPPADVAAALSDLGLPSGRRIVLSTGNRLPHKNFEGLLAAIATIDSAERPVVVIPGGGPDDPLVETVRRHGLEHDVVLPGWVTGEQLEALYAIADLYVCPSLSEGFGLPVIDAMRRGCVVLTHDIPVLREVGGSASMYADATTPAPFGRAIADALASLPDDRRRNAGREWASRFTWEASAEGTARVLSKAATVRRAGAA